MQIIDKTDCYVSKNDLLHLFDNDECMPYSLQLGLRDALVNNKDYVKIEDEKGQEYIYSSDIPSFDKLLKYKISDLRAKIIDVIIESSIDNNNGNDLTLNEMIRIKRRREYMISVLKEMIAFQKRKPEILYPDIPFPYLTGITNDTYNACLSYNLDRVIILDKEGKKVENVDDVEFCMEAFKTLAQCEKDDLSLDMNYDGNYFVIKNSAKKLIKKQ